MSDGITREVLQGFIDSKKKVDPRTKKNLLDAVKAMMTFGKSIRNVPVEWEEAKWPAPAAGLSQVGLGA